MNEKTFILAIYSNAENFNLTLAISTNPNHRLALGINHLCGRAPFSHAVLVHVNSTPQ